ncbi:hypothetical protein C5167_010799 [Papaver somniferum]|uniref:Cytochrome P450 n=1 Tax=Papaver somniferum TaxID=3469 RepID=A0A4Y7K572_PAPSO|nr:cytochrome P450 71A9-like [Papaver somniferum]RZC67108.1 hypothetical protein C5167_010799 [Papaver somniferum]
MRAHYYYHNFVVLLLVFSITLLVLLWKQLTRKNRNGRLPPGPRRIPLIGNLHQLGGGSPHVSLKRLSDEYGPLMFLKLGSIPTLVVSSRDMAKEILKTHDLVLTNRPMFYAPTKISYGGSDIAFARYGEHWREVKKIAVLELLSAKRVLSYRAVREKETSLVIDFVRTSASSSVPINLSEIFLCLISNVVCQVAFGMKFEAEKGYEAGLSNLYMMLLETQNLLAGFNTGDLFPWMSWIHKFDGLETRLEKNFRQADKFYEQVFNEHVNRNKSSKTGVEDFVDVLLRTQTDPSYNISLTKDHIKGILMDIFVAGSDPAAATLVWSMTELIKNSTVMKIAREEVRTKIGTKKMVEESDLHKLSYTKLVIKEALRLHPPAPLLLRETNEACTINGYEIPVKTKVIINGNAVSTDPKYWENPEEFQPERFLNNISDFKGQDFEMLPFGGGRRGCPGMNFAAVLVELVLANFLHCFDWKLPCGMKAEDIHMKEASGLTMHKKVPLCLLASIRK